MMLDARNKRLALWYEEHDFRRFPGQFRMFKSIEAIRTFNLILWTLDNQFQPRVGIPLR
jgi:hypothetical protein